MAQRDMKETVGTAAKVLLWLVYAWVIVNLVLLFLAFVLQLLGANPDAGFAEWVYRSVRRSMAPFRGLFEPIELSGQSVLDTSLLFAMIVYGFVALFLKAAIDWLTGRVARRHREVAHQHPDALPGADPLTPQGGG
jgi:uncharacterized protein YggT (Ycf19 family)